MRIGVVVPLLNNFAGYADFTLGLKSEHELKLQLIPQYRNQVPLSKAWNLGAYSAIAESCEYILISNDDILLSPYTIDNMVESFKLLPKEVILVSANNLYNNEQMPDPFGMLSKPKEDPKEMTYSEHPNFSCFMIKKDFFDKVGTFDENFTPAWFEDNDMHYRINLLGYKAVCTTYASCIHFGSVTSAIAGKADSSTSKSYYFKKWGGLPEGHGGKEQFKTPYNKPELTAKDWLTTEGVEL